MKIMFGEKFHIMVKISKDFPAASISFRQIQEKISTEVLPRRGCWETSEAKVLGASRFCIGSIFGWCITKMVDFRSCEVRIRVSEVVCSKKLQFSKLCFTKSMWIRIRDMPKFSKSDSWCNAMPTWADLPGAHILTDAHLTNGWI